MALIGARLKADRLQAGIKQKEAADAAGVDRSTISNWEAGRGLPNLLQYRALCVLYGVMGYQTLMGDNPIQLTRAESLELSHAARSFSTGLYAKVDLMLSLFAKAGEEETATR